jgi:hypothetical protein
VSVAAQARARRKRAIVLRTHGDPFSIRRMYSRTSSLGGPSALTGKVSKTARKSGAK